MCKRSSWKQHTDRVLKEATNSDCYGLDVGPYLNVITGELQEVVRSEGPVLTHFLQRLQKCDQVCFLLGRQAEIEALIIELDDIAERVGPTVVEVWCTCR